MRYYIISILVSILMSVTQITVAQTGDIYSGDVFTGTNTGDVADEFVELDLLDPIDVVEEEVQGHSLFPEVVPEIIQEAIVEKNQEVFDDAGEEENDIQLQPKPSGALVEHEMVPLVLEPIEIIEEIEYCEDGEEIQEEGEECDDENYYTDDDVIGEDGCTCAGKVPPIKIVESKNNVQYSEDGLPLLSSVESFDVTGGGAPRCSMIARLNLNKFYPEKSYSTSIVGSHKIVLGDAVTLIEQGKANGVLSEVEARDVAGFLESSDEFAHDLFIHSPKGYSIDSPAYYLQGHRAVVFQASDYQWYVIDPLRGKANTSPQVLREYLYHHTNKNGTYYMYTDITSGDTQEDYDNNSAGLCNIALGGGDLGSILLQENSDGQFCFDIQNLCK